MCSKNFHRLCLRDISCAEHCAGENVLVVVVVAESVVGGCDFVDGGRSR